MNAPVIISPNPTFRPVSCQEDHVSQNCGYLKHHARNIGGCLGMNDVEFAILVEEDQTTAFHNPLGVVRDSPFFEGVVKPQNENISDLLLEVTNSSYH